MQNQLRFRVLRAEGPESAELTLSLDLLPDDDHVDVLVARPDARPALDHGHVAKQVELLLELHRHRLPLPGPRVLWHREVSLEADSRPPDCSDDVLERLRLPEADLA